jgi:hypothetical protein
VSRVVLLKESQFELTEAAGQGKRVIPALTVRESPYPGGYGRCTLRALWLIRAVRGFAAG